MSEVVAEVGADHIPYVCIGTAVNVAGGQPISLASLHQACAPGNEQGIRIIHDAMRVAETACFIEEREPGHEGKTVAASSSRSSP